MLSPVANCIRRTALHLFTVSAWAQLAAETSHYFAFPTPLYSYFILYNSKQAKAQACTRMHAFPCYTPPLLLSYRWSGAAKFLNYKHCARKGISFPREVHTADNAPLSRSDCNLGISMHSRHCSELSSCPPTSLEPMCVPNFKRKLEISCHLGFSGGHCLFSPLHLSRSLLSSWHIPAVPSWPWGIRVHGTPWKEFQSLLFTFISVA